jgi:A118 family predicted phage portal protein
LLSQKVGLGNGYYRFDTSGGMTATEVVSKNSDTWRNRNKHAKVLRETLADMMRAILHLEKSVGGYSGNPDELEYYVHFDDSVIVDDGKRLEELKADVLDGFVPKYRYVADKYHITDEEAKEWLAESQEEDRRINQMFVDSFEEGLDDEPADEA